MEKAKKTGKACKKPKPVINQYFYIFFIFPRSHKRGSEEMEFDEEWINEILNENEDFGPSSKGTSKEQAEPA